VFATMEILITAVSMVKMMWYLHR